MRQAFETNEIIRIRQLVVIQVEFFEIRELITVDAEAREFFDL